MRVNSSDCVALKLQKSGIVKKKNSHIPSFLEFLSPLVPRAVRGVPEKKIEYAGELQKKLRVMLRTLNACVLKAT